MANNTLTSMNAAFKIIQDKQLKDLKPNSSILYDMAPMREAESLGRKYICPVVLSYELGFTYGNGDAFDYNDAIAGTYEEIEIDSNPVVLKSRISIEAADRAAKSEKSAQNLNGLKAGQMKASLLKLAELDMLHGRTGLGTISGDPVVATNATIIFTAATWAEGIWAGMKGVLLEARTSGGTKRNALADLVLVSVDYENRSIVVSGNSTDLADLADTDVIYMKGAYAGSQYGIKYQLDFSGSVFGIDNSVYELWKAQEHPVGGALTFEQVLKGRAKAVTRAGLDEDSVLLVNPKTFESLNSDLAALAMIDSRYDSRSQEVGTQGIVYHGQGGKVRVLAHPFMMEGDAFMLPEGCLRKIGSTEITFKGPSGADDAWEKLEGSHGYQMVGRYSFQVLIPEPAKCVYFKGIVNP